VHRYKKKKNDHTKHSTYLHFIQVTHVSVRPPKATGAKIAELHLRLDVRMSAATGHGTLQVTTVIKTRCSFAQESAMNLTIPGYY
jgi:hypothetical protein